MRKFSAWVALLLSLSLLLCGCQLNSTPEEPSIAQRPTYTNAVVISEVAYLYDEAMGNQVGQLSKDTAVTFSETVDTGSEFWVRCESPVAGTWMLLSDLQITASNSMTVYLPGTVVDGDQFHMILDPDGGLTVLNPDGSAVEEDATIGVWTEDAAATLFGAYFHVPYDENGYHGSITSWYFGSNGYALLETGDGEVDGSTVYLNYTNLRLFGTYAIQGDKLTFTVTEDWYYAHGENIGKVFTYDFAAAGENLILDGETYIPMAGMSDYLEEVNGHPGGPTGNDLTDPNYSPPVHGKLSSEAWGTWVSFEREGVQQVRRMWTFYEPQTNMHPCIYQEHILDQIGGSWEILPVSPSTEYYFDSHYTMNGQLYLDYGPEVFGPYDLSIQGDTMTVTHTNWEGITETHTYTRTTSTNPKP